MIKIGAAFVTGVLAALLAAVLYIKVAGRGPSEQPVRSAPAAVAAPQSHVDTTPPSEEEPAPPATAEPDPKPSRRDRLASLGHKFKHETVGHDTPAEAPAHDEIAQAPPAPDYASTPPQTQPVSDPKTAAPTPAPARQPQSVTLDTGMSLVVRLNQALSTDKNYAGDTFHGTLEIPITMNGFIIAEKGSKVLGRIVDVQKPGHLQGLADLSLALTEINTTDGQRVEVETSSFDKKGASNAAANAAKIGGGAALGAIIGAIADGGKGAGIGAGIGGAAGAGDVLLTHGKPAAIPNETVLTFRLSAPVTITERLN